MSHPSARELPGTDALRGRALHAAGVKGSQQPVRSLRAARSSRPREARRLPAPCRRGRHARRTRRAPPRSCRAPRQPASSAPLVFGERRGRRRVAHGLRRDRREQTRLGRRIRLRRASPTGAPAPDAARRAIAPLARRQNPSRMNPRSLVDRSADPARTPAASCRSRARTHGDPAAGDRAAARSTRRRVRAGVARSAFSRSAPAHSGQIVETRSSSCSAPCSASLSATLVVAIGLVSEARSKMVSISVAEASTSKVSAPNGCRHRTPPLEPTSATAAGKTRRARAVSQQVCGGGSAVSVMRQLVP